MPSTLKVSTMDIDQALTTSKRDQTHLQSSLSLDQRKSSKFIALSPLLNLTIPSLQTKKERSFESPHFAINSRLHLQQLL